MITNEILKTLLDNAALSEKDGLTFKEIQSCTTEAFTVKVLQSMRVDGLINNAMNRSVNVWWLTAKVADMALVDIETMKTIPEPEPQCPASVGGDIDPDNETENVYTEESNTMLDEPLDITEPEYDPAVVAFNQHTDNFINAINEKDYISGIVVENTQVHFELIDQHGDTVGTFEDPFSAMKDALKHAAVGGKFTVEKVIVERIGVAKPVTSSVWEFA